MEAKEAKLSIEKYNSVLADGSYVKKEILEPELNHTHVPSFEKDVIEISSDGPAPNDAPLDFEGNLSTFDGPTLVFRGHTDSAPPDNSCAPADTTRISTGNTRDPARAPADTTCVPSGSHHISSSGRRVSSGKTNTRLASGSRRVPSVNLRVPSGSRSVASGNNTPNNVSTSAMTLDGDLIEIPDSEEERINKKSRKSGHGE